MTRATIIKAIKDHYKDVYPIPLDYDKTSNTQFMFDSFTNWAYATIIEALDKTEKPPMTVLENWRDFVDHYACISKSDISATMFAIMYDLITDVQGYVASLYMAHHKESELFDLSKEDDITWSYIPDGSH